MRLQLKTLPIIVFLMGTSWLGTWSTAYAAQDPATLFQQTCGNCHQGQTPLAATPGDPKWQALIQSQGMPELVKRVMEGYNSMPPGGLCMQCSAADHEALILWMSQPKN